MPDVAGRRRAVFVGLTVATIVLSGIPIVASSATAPPGINRFLYALGRVESGGNYYARNATTGAYGKYQILPSNWPTWAKLYVGTSTASWTPTNQEKVARGKVTALWNWLGSWENVAHWWLTGSGDTNQSHWSSYSRYYVARVMKIYSTVSEATAAADVMAEPEPLPIGKVVTTTRRIGDTDIGIAYAGRWQSARHVGYADREVRYAQANGATATYAFYGSSIAWVGPVGPTRGRAKVIVDGRTVATVDLRRSSFKPRVTLFDQSWKRAGKHTLTIRVVGNGRPVAIDEFVVTR